MSDNGSRQPIHQAAQNGHTEVVKLLLEKGAEADSLDFKQITPLWSAAQEGCDQIVRLLIEKGADLEATSADGSRRPIHQAAQNGHTEVVKLQRTEMPILSPCMQVISPSQ
ncbi:hypothetical protein VTN00DRAFT_3073 [Thermoascus crustaceus]|uniref:uncharacterized protein n=1 Tax=Thermoascus crustaceus TaxID=5088 RepID=UPI003743AAAC